MIVSEAEKATTLVNTLPSNHPPTMQAAMLISPEGFGINEESLQLISSDSTMLPDGKNSGALFVSQVEAQTWGTVR